MYQPRRIAEIAAVEASLEVDGAVAAALRSGPRRIQRSAFDAVLERVAPVTVSVALLATAGALVLSPRGVLTPQANAAVNDTVASASEFAATDAESDGAVAEAAPTVAPVASWATAFGAVTGTQYAQAATGIRAQASTEAEKLGELKAGDKIQVTDRTVGDFREVVFEKKVGYVLAGKLGKSAPSSNKYTGSTTYSGKSVLGLRPSAMVVYNAVMAKWNVPSVGGYRASSLSNHQLGLAIDFMVDRAMGDAIAAFLVANAGTFNIDHIIWRQRIWTPANPTWRGMADRGSITANHYDHVHVSLKS